MNDVIFQTTDPLGFNTSGPGPFQLYVQQAGLEGTSLLNPDLRVDFLHGATGSIQFGFAATVFGARFPIPPIQSTFTEGLLNLPFSGTAAYGLFNFSSSTPTGRYFLDNFTGTFGSTETVPEPAATALFAAGLTALLLRRRQRKHCHPPTPMGQ